MMGDPVPNNEPRNIWPWVLAGLAALMALCLCISGVAGFVAYQYLKDDLSISDLVGRIGDDTSTDEEPTAEPPIDEDEPPDEFTGDEPTGEDVSIQYAGHIEEGESHTPYNSDPPTSGEHYAVPAQAGFYTAEDDVPPDEQLVHNLEHGYVIIWYNCDDLTDEECEQLQDDIQFAMQNAGNSINTGTPKLIAVPRPGMDALIALTTWGRLDKFDAFSEKRIVNFIHDFRDQAPEPNVP
jgi:hypothetical protein